MDDSTARQRIVGTDFNKRLCEAIGIDPGRCTGLTFEFKAGKLPRIVATFHVTRQTAGMLEVLTREETFEIRRDDKDAAEGS